MARAIPLMKRKGESHTKLLKRAGSVRRAAFMHMGQAGKLCAKSAKGKRVC